MVVSLELPIITLDWNALLALQNGDSDAPMVEELLEMQRKEEIRINVTLSTALENPPAGQKSDPTALAHWFESLGIKLEDIYTHAHSFSNPDVEFAIMQRIHQILFPNIPFDWRDYLEKQYESFSEIEQAAIRELDASRHPYIPQSPSHPAKRPNPTLDQIDQSTCTRLEGRLAKWNKTWRNSKNDALGLYNHITKAINTNHPEWAIFVTNDENFWKESRTRALKAMGLQINILSPTKAVIFLKSLRVSLKDE